MACANKSRWKELREMASKILRDEKEATRAQWAQHLSNSNLLPMRLPQVETLEAGQEYSNDNDHIHTSHLRSMVRSIVFCRRCGYWASKKSQKLKEACLGAPANNFNKGTLKRLLNGFHPDCKKVTLWPDGAATSVPTPPIPLD